VYDVYTLHNNRSYSTPKVRQHRWPPIEHEAMSTVACLKEAQLHHLASVAHLAPSCTALSFSLTASTMQGHHWSCRQASTMELAQSSERQS
jgi:hypothetical protein